MPNSKAGSDPVSAPDEASRATASRRTVIAAGVAAAGVAATGAGATTALAQTPGPKPAGASAAATGAENPSTLSFKEIEHALGAKHAISPGHNVQVLLRWGDPLTPAAPAWNPETQTAAKQAVQFGYDNDFIAFMPLPYGSGSSERGLLCINHESARNQMMFPGFSKRKLDDVEKEFADVEQAAVGHTIVEVAFAKGTWSIDRASKYNRRITALTEIDIAGPAAGHARMRTRDDPKGTTVLGTLGNCAGGETPWGTVLTAEENIHHYFGGDPRRTPEGANHLAMGISVERFYGWHVHAPRFNVEAEPHEPNRFGWMVEIDPFDPGKRPAKRTAMGRFKHEGAGVTLSPDGRVVCYMGDDEVFQHIYKFVSRRPFDKGDRARNWGLLDDGTLYVARFNDDFTLEWLPLTWGTGPLTAANGFAGPADVMIEARRAAALLGATPMDRPEDLEVNKFTNSVFVALTKNSRRGAEQADAANPRSRNRHGHIMEIVPPIAAGNVADHAAAQATWRIFLLAGNPEKEEVKAKYPPGVTASGWLSNPDNFAVDPRGRLWITTDGANDFGFSDGLWAADVVGAGRAVTRHFFSCPVGGELTGPAFTPDGTTLFCSVQHPGDDGKSSFVNPATRWPDFKDGVPPRPSVIVIRAADGKPIGG